MKHQPDWPGQTATLSFTLLKDTIMNPFEMTNLIHPTIARDYRIAQSSSRDSELNYSLSRMAFRLVDGAAKLFARASLHSNSTS